VTEVACYFDHCTESTALLLLSSSSNPTTKLHAQISHVIPFTLCLEVCRLMASNRV